MKGPWGLVAEFHEAEHVVEAAHRVRLEGYTKIDAFSPYPMHELTHALALPRSPLPKLVLGGGVVGLAAGWALQYWSSVIEYPLNIGGRPFNSWPAFIVPAFETTILFAAASAVLGMLALNGLPEPYHPVFHAPGFALASRDKFFVSIEARDPKYDSEATRRFVESLPGVTDVTEVPH